jgi:hypothetical protein
MYEGWMGTWKNPGEEKAGGSQQFEMNKNLYGSTALIGNLYTDPDVFVGD